MKTSLKTKLLSVAILFFLLSSTTYGQAVVINEVSAGDDLIELHNTTNADIDLEGYYLSDGIDNLTEWQIHQLNPTTSNPSGNVIEAQGFVIIRAIGATTISANHFNANFRLSGGGETVYLSNPSGVLVDSLAFPPLPLTHSYGRLSNGSLGYFVENTLGDTNNPSLPNIDSLSYQRDLDLEVPVISAPYDIFNGSVDVELLSSTNTPIYYTLDGSTPDINSLVYNGPFTVNNTTVVKAAHANAQGIIGRPALRTFLFNVDHSIPIVNITTEHYEDRVKIGNFFGAPTMDGRIKVDFFESNGDLGFEEYATYERSGGGGSSDGYQINGKIGISDESSSDHFNNHFYPSKPEIEEVENFLINNASQDQYRAHIRDVFFARLVSEDALIDFGFEDSRPVVAYVNGVYEGVLQIKEDDDRYFDNHNFPGQDPENELIQLNDFSASQDVNEIDSIIGLENLFFYAWHEFFMGGTEHDVNVFRFADGSHYAASHDDDISFGIFETAQVQPMTSTVTFDAVNIDFAINNYIPSSLHHQMFQSWCSYSNFLYDTTRTISILDEMEAELEPEMTLHTAYMQNALSINPEIAINGPVSTTLAEWKDEIDIIRQTLQIRTTGFFNKLQTDFGLTNKVELTATTNDTLQGSVEIEGVKLREQTMTGPFFSQEDIQLKAIPEPGFRFVEWQGLDNSIDDEITIQMVNAGSILAIFEPIPITEVALSINEVQSRNDFTYADEFGEYDDWVEIYNAEGHAIDLAGYFLSDNRDIPNKHEIKATDASRTTVDSEGFIILWLDNDTIQGPNHAGFKLSGEDQIYLVHPDGLTIIDSLSFDLNTDQSFGAVEDGVIGNNIVFDVPTPGSTNKVVLAPVIAAQDNVCPSVIGSFSVSVDCGANSHIEFSVDNGLTWTTVIPTWADGVTVIARCVNDTDSNCVSTDSNVVTAQLNCCPTCYGIGIVRN